ncbi:MAG: hypothetical protein AAFR61_10345 [Bacteroidota bacterium]
MVVVNDIPATSSSTAPVSPAITISSPYRHTMGPHLEAYLETKVHHLFYSGHFDQISIEGKYFPDRHPDWISRTEKKDKLFNYKRPLACLEEGVLRVFTYPGKSYIRHIASIYGTMAKMRGDSYNISVQPVTLKDQEEAVAQTNIEEVPPGDVIVLGYVEELKLDDFPAFQGKGDFQWSLQWVNGQQVCLLGSKICYWGDTGEIILRELAKKGYKKVFYLAKLGGLKMYHKPNLHLATGNTTIVDQCMIRWQNMFEPIISDYKGIHTGHHVTSPSVISEDKAWLKKHRVFHFVDSEIGYFARACSEHDMAFSYLHIITNNLTQPYHPESLANERTKSVMIKRQKLLAKMREMLWRVI